MILHTKQTGRYENDFAAHAYVCLCRSMTIIGVPGSGNGGAGVDRWPDYECMWADTPQFEAGGEGDANVVRVIVL